MAGMVILAILTAGIASIFTDWLFMGLLFHDRYSRYPEVWREGIAGGKDRTAVIYSSALDFVAAAGIVALCALADIHTLRPALAVALFAWIAGPLRHHDHQRLLHETRLGRVGAHSAGYLVRFLLAAVAVAFFL